MFHLYSLQERTGDVDAHQRHTVRVQFMQRFNSPTVTAFALRSVHHLPCLIVFLLDAVARLIKIEDDREKDGKTSHVLQDFQKVPVAQKVRNPFPNELNGQKWHCPGMFKAAALFGPGRGLLSMYLDQHGPTILRLSPDLSIIAARQDALEHRRESPFRGRPRKS